MITVMAKANIFEVKARFSHYVDRAAAGERIVICRHNHPVAELRPVAAERTEPRPVGPLPGRPSFELSPSFFEPLADDEMSEWEGGAPPLPIARSTAPGRGGSKVAEVKAAHSARAKRPSARRRS
jgi:prevent-host-death family protein